MNKYISVPKEIIDLHGHTKAEAEEALAELIHDGTHSHVRIITGRGLHSPNGPVLREFVAQYLLAHNISYTRSKLEDGGEGAVEVYF